MDACCFFSLQWALLAKVNLFSAGLMEGRPKC